MTHDPIIFNRKRVLRHYERAASEMSCDFLLREMASRLVDRLPDIRKTFPTVLDLGAHNGLLSEYLGEESGIEMLVQADLSKSMIEVAEGKRVVADEEYLPFAAGSFDLVISAGALHWVNDVPGTLIQIQRILKSGGLFLAIFPGGETLKELRHSFEQAEIKICGGISPRVSPFIDVKDAGSLLQRAGFEEPVTDSETLAVMYESPLNLLHDLRAMGQTNAIVASQKTFMRRSLLEEMVEYYTSNFSQDNRITATFELITMTAWKADDAG